MLKDRMAVKAATILRDTMLGMGVFFGRSGGKRGGGDGGEWNRSYALKKKHNAQINPSFIEVELVSEEEPDEARPNLKDIERLRYTEMHVSLKSLLSSSIWMRNSINVEKLVHVVEATLV